MIGTEINNYIDQCVNAAQDIADFADKAVDAYIAYNEFMANAMINITVGIYDATIGSAINNWVTVYNNMQETGSGFWTSVYAATGTILAEATGVLSIDNAIQGEDLYTGRQLSGTERFLEGASGGIQLISTAFGGLNMVRSTIRATGGCQTALGKVFTNCCFTAGTQVLVGQTETVTSTAVQTNETEVHYHNQGGNYRSFIVTLAFGASAVVLKTAEKKRKRQKEIEQQYFKDLFTDLDVDPVDLDNDTLERIAERQPALQSLWNESPETCTEVLFSELETAIQSNEESVTVNPKKKLLPKKSTTGWLGYAGTFFFILAIISLLWNFLPSDNKVEAVSQVAAKPVPVVETKYITKNIEDIQEGDEVLACDVRTGETVKSQVTSTVHLKCDHLRYLTVRDNNGTEQTFQTTDTHPFWVNSDRPDLFRKARDSVSEHDISTNTDVRFEHDNLYVTDTGYYVEAKDLKIGDNFIGPNGEASVLVKTWREAHPEGIDVYNFKVADNSNYFVIANYADFQNDAEPVLVHNGETCLKAKTCSLKGRQLSNEYSSSHIRKLKKDMQKNGFDENHPIIVAEIDNKMIIIDGHHRARAAGSAGIKEVPIIIESVSDSQALEYLQQAAEAAEWFGLPWN